MQVRGERFLSPLKDRGWLARLVNLEVDGESRFRSLCRRSDLIYFLKVADFSWYEKARVWSHGRLLFDITDALWEPSQHSYWADLDRILQYVDGVTSLSEIDTAYARRHNNVVFPVRPSAPITEFDAVARRRTQRKDGRVRIGWVGSTSTSGAIDYVRPALERIGRRFPEAELRVLGCPTPKLQHLYCSALESYNEMAMINEILDLDVGLFPPPLDLEDYCVRGPLKALLYMAGRVPPICQNAGQCAEIIRDGENGMLANGIEEWGDKLEALITSSELRRQLGVAAHKTVADTFSISRVCDQLEYAFSTILRKPSGRSPFFADPHNDDLPNRRFRNSQQSVAR